MAFDSFMVSVREVVKDDEILEKFGKLSTDKQRIEYVERLPCVKDLIVTENFGRKSEEKAKELLEKGNVCFSNENYHQALKSFTFAVKLAPSSSDTLSQSFLARARTLYATGYYQQAAEDAHRSLKGQLMPLDTIIAIQLEGRCQQKLSLKAEAEASFQRALEFLRSSSVKNEEKACIAKELAQDMKTTKKLCSKESNAATEEVLPQLDYGQNPKIPAASAALKLCWTAEKGHHFVASRDIKMGSVLIAEQPYAWSLSTEAMAQHCLHCCRLNKAPLPCQQCSTVGYCSEKCQNAAWDLYHKFECQILNHFTQAQDMSKMGLVSYRVVITARLGWQFDKLSTDDKNDLVKLAHQSQMNLCKEFDENCERTDKEFLSSAYSSVYRQLTHSKDRTTSDLFKRTVSAVFLAKCSRRTPASVIDEQCLAEYILHHLQSCSCNAYQISEQIVVMNNFKAAVDSELGGSVYPTISLTNHSCNPNVVRLSYGNKCIVSALMNIRSGEEILDNYGPHFLLNSKSERHSQLKLQYFFDCKCEACKKNWPTVTQLRDSSTNFKCNHCGYDVGVAVSGTCKSCKRKLDFKKQLQRLKKLKGNLESALELVSVGKFEESLKMSLAYATILEPIVVHPCIEFIRWQQIIRLSWSLMGNVHRRSSDEDD